MGNYNYKKGISAMLCCFLIWGFQPLYWYLCEGMDPFFLLACRIIFAAVFNYPELSYDTENVDFLR